eukprot:CAMPEP_0194060646 /NCGR_PEP_ID=MMETSP0009_2-20130614/72340_1 /TAXON_ID=210454 /ORGANISM="Grammatophora oceanica, Strain CCMP 410" /LENGTH=85 /DNA_ID=CAMNT_0038711615 /DNA_START=235 /DNA_END=492 /DNA_ORIENTATION=-
MLGLSLYSRSKGMFENLLLAPGKTPMLKAVRLIRRMKGNITQRPLQPPPHRLSAIRWPSVTDVGTCVEPDGVFLTCAGGNGVERR